MNKYLIGIIIGLFLIGVIYLLWSARNRSAYSIILAHDAPESFRMETQLRQQGNVKQAYELRARNVRKLIRKTHRFFTDYSIPYWAESGVLLGIHNLNDVLPYDADEDVGVTQHGKEIIDKIYESLPQKGNRVYLTEYGLRLKKTDDKSLIYTLEDSETDVYCDIFYYELKNSELVQLHYTWPCRKCSWNKFKMPADYVFPLKEISCGSGDDTFVISVPSSPRNCLEYMYGPKLEPNYKWSDEKNDYIM